MQSRMIGSRKLRNWIAAGIALSAGSVGGKAQAQTAATGAGTMPLPQGVTKVISIDLHNYLLAESVDAEGKKHYNVIQPRHVYSGGLARIFGGTIIPTADLVIPASANEGRSNRSGFFSIRSNQPFQQTAPFAGAVPPNGGVISGPFSNR